MGVAERFGGSVIRAAERISRRRGAAGVGGAGGRQEHASGDADAGRGGSGAGGAGRAAAGAGRRTPGAEGGDRRRVSAGVGAAARAAVARGPAPDAGSARGAPGAGGTGPLRPGTTAARAAQRQTRLRHRRAILADGAARRGACRDFGGEAGSSRGGPRCTSREGAGDSRRQRYSGSDTARAAGRESPPCHSFAGEAGCNGEQRGLTATAYRGGQAGSAAIATAVLLRQRSRLRQRQATALRRRSVLRQRSRACRVLARFRLL